MARLSGLLGSTGRCSARKDGNNSMGWCWIPFAVIVLGGAVLAWEAISYYNGLRPEEEGLRPHRATLGIVILLIACAAWIACVEFVPSGSPELLAVPPLP